jgi:copper chaperone CopZ
VQGVSPFTFGSSIKKNGTMKHTIFILTLVVFGLGACQSDSSNKQLAPITVTELESEINKSVAKLHVTGMTCKAGCGGKIEMELQGLPGIKSTETLFEDNRPENVVTVEFDPASVNASAMEAVVEKIMDGKYQVSKIEVLNYHGLQSHGAGGADVSDQGMGFSELFKLLNVFQSLGKLLSSDL